ncbi:hypothetical protein BLOT_005319 [Blomia tropicalis]|nr:hypothetical protein BLOT_005319 [Blomia tropicalis]
MAIIKIDLGLMHVTIVSIGSRASAALWSIVDQLVSSGNAPSKTINDDLSMLENEKNITRNGKKLNLNLNLKLGYFECDMIQMPIL